MAVINSGKTFSNGEQLTADKLNQVLSEATFDLTNSVDGSSTHVVGGAIGVKDGGITPAKLSAGGPSWDTNGRLTIDGEIRVGDDTGDGPPLGYIKGSRVGTVDTLKLEGNDLVHIGTTTVKDVIVINNDDDIKIGTKFIGTIKFDSDSSTPYNDNLETSEGLVYNGGGYTQCARWQGTPLYLNYMGAAAGAAYTGQYFAVNGVGVGTLKVTEGGGLEITQLSDYPSTECLNQHLRLIGQLWAHAPQVPFSLTLHVPSLRASA